MVQQQQLMSEEPCNNIVAQSDYDAALAAIESMFDNFQLSQNENLDHSLDQDMINEMYKNAKASLMNNVKRVVRPIDDDVYNEYVDQYHIIEEEESDNDDADGDSDQDLGARDEEIDEEEEEIDEEELIDMKAWKDAQELRTRIRTISDRVQSVRERVLKRTEDGILSSISKELIDQPIEIIFDDTDGDASNDKENSGKNIGSNKNSIDTTALRESLRDLSKMLKDPKWTHLPNKIQSLQDTIETVQKETTEGRVMSQTEVAITSLYNKTIDEASRRKVFDEDAEQEDISLECSGGNAMDRLALFGQLFS